MPRGCSGAAGAVRGDCRAGAAAEKRGKAPPGAARSSAARAAAAPAAASRGGKRPTDGRQGSGWGGAAGAGYLCENY